MSSQVVSAEVQNPELRKLWETFKRRMNETHKWYRIKDPLSEKLGEKAVEWFWELLDGRNKYWKLWLKWGDVRCAKVGIPTTAASCCSGIIIEKSVVGANAQSGDLKKDLITNGETQKEQDYICKECEESVPRSQFSKSQLKKSKATMQCKCCVNGPDHADEHETCEITVTFSFQVISKNGRFLFEHFSV